MTAQRKSDRSGLSAARCVLRSKLGEYFLTIGRESGIEVGEAFLNLLLKFAETHLVAGGLFKLLGAGCVHAQQFRAVARISQVQRCEVALAGRLRATLFDRELPAKSRLERAGAFAVSRVSGDGFEPGAYCHGVGWK